MQETVKMTDFEDRTRSSNVNGMNSKRKKKGTDGKEAIIFFFNS